MITLRNMSLFTLNYDRIVFVEQTEFMARRNGRKSIENIVYRCDFPRSACSQQSQDMPVVSLNSYVYYN